jgi:two-component system response regulator MprA
MATLPIVLVIDDDKDMGAYIATLLRKNDLQVKTTETGAAGLALVEKIKPSLILLDLHLPDIDGESICRAIRKSNPEIPIIMFTAQDSVSGRVKGLESGADDYIAKPFAPEELIARIRARLRASSTGVDGVLEIDDLVLDPKRVAVSRGGKNIELTPNEFKLLEYLMSNVGIVLTRDMILNHVWMYAPDVETRVVDVYMGYLRKKIDTRGKKPLLRSVRGFGYTIKST